MAGLSLGIGGQRQLGKVGPFASGTVAPATIAQTAYGAQNTPMTSSSKGVQTWHASIIVPVVGTAWLAFLRWSLPK